MRINTNPSKGTKVSLTEKYIHRIVIPLYIPNFEGYFSQSLEVFKLCLSSLQKTIHKKTAITIINNGSCNGVVDFLNDKFKNGVIQELVHTGSIGKINALLKVLKTVEEELITISDSDIFFLNGWQDETVNIFSTFPKSGVVGLIPQLNLYTSLSYNLLFDNLTSNNLMFKKFVNMKALERFYQSIGWDFKSMDFFKTNLVIKSKKGKVAIVGSGHAVATYKNEVFRFIPNENCKYKLGGTYIRTFLDEPVLKTGGWRLTTEDNYAYHMGNTYENWMSLEIKSLNNESNRKIPKYNFNLLKISKMNYMIKNKLFKKLISNKKIINFYLSLKSLK